MAGIHVFFSSIMLFETRSLSEFTHSARLVGYQTSGTCLSPLPGAGIVGSAVFTERSKRRSLGLCLCASSLLTEPLLQPHPS